MDKELEVTVSLRNNKIKAARKRLGLTQKQLSIQLGLNPQIVGHAERMHLECVPKRAREIIADFLGLEVSEVWHREHI